MPKRPLPHMPSAKMAAGRRSGMAATKAAMTWHGLGVSFTHEPRW